MLLLATTLCVLLALAARGRCEHLAFSDEFDHLDESKWGHLVTAWGGGNQEFQYYRNDRRNSYVRDGILYLKPTFTADEFGEDFLYHGRLSYPDCNKEPCVSQSGREIVHPVLSARISTEGKFSFKFGRLEIRARLPRGDWLWPALWLLPQEWKYGDWPRSGEIDLMESRGNERLTYADGRQAGLRAVGSTLHFGPAWNQNGWSHATYSKTVDSDTLADDFHVYTFDWNENGVKFLLDGQLIGERPAPEGGFWKLGGFQGDNIWKNGGRMAPFDQKFYIVMNLAVGGHFFGDDLRNLPHPRPYNLASGMAKRQFWEKRGWWKGTWQDEKAALAVDYVRVYQS